MKESRRLAWNKLRQTICKTIRVGCIILTFLQLVGADYRQPILPCIDVGKFRSVHSGIETAEKPVQTIKKTRGQSDKIGRSKYNQQLLSRR
jgi:hypothetical protein